MKAVFKTPYQEKFGCLALGAVFTTQLDRSPVFMKTEQVYSHGEAEKYNAVCLACQEKENIGVHFSFPDGELVLVWKPELTLSR